MGKPMIALKSLAVASFVHWPLAYYLGHHLGWNITGCAIASSIQFFMRFITNLHSLLTLPEFKNNMVSFRDKRSWEGLWELHKVSF